MLTIHYLHHPLEHYLSFFSILIEIYVESIKMVSFWHLNCCWQDQYEVSCSYQEVGESSCVHRFLVLPVPYSLSFFFLLHFGHNVIRIKKNKSWIQTPWFQVLDALISPFCQTKILTDTLSDGSWLLRQLLLHSETEFNTFHLQSLKVSWIYRLMNHVNSYKINLYEWFNLDGKVGYAWRKGNMKQVLKK